MGEERLQEWKGKQPPCLSPENVVQRVVINDKLSNNQVGVFYFLRHLEKATTETFFIKDEKCYRVYIEEEKPLNS